MSECKNEIDRKKSLKVYKLTLVVVSVFQSRNKKKQKQKIPNDDESTILSGTKEKNLEHLFSP